MSANLSEWVERLGKISLPAIPFTLQRIPLLLDRQNTTNAHFERVIGRDPGFALALFRALGRQSEQLEGPISSLAHAVSMLGVDAVTHTKRVLKVLEPPSKKHDTESLYECYSRAAHAAVYALRLAQGHHDERPEQIAIAALLHGCGEMALWVDAPEEMQKIEQLITSGDSRDHAAISVLGCTLEQLSLGLAELWHLPPLVIRAVSPDGAFEERPLGVMIASALAQETVSGWYSDEVAELIELTADYQRITPQKATGCCHSWAAEAAANLYDLTMPLSVYSLMNPEIITSPAMEERATTAESPRPQTAAASNKPTQAVEKPAPSQEKSLQIDSQLLQEQVILTFREMREKLGVKRAMFARLTPDNRVLKVKFVIGAEKNAPLRQFQLNLDDKHLFSLLMKRPQCFWLKPANRDKYLPLIPESLQPSLEMSGFFAVSIFVRQQPLGLIYVDFPSLEHLTQEGYELFRQLGQTLGTELGNRD